MNGCPGGTQAAPDGHFYLRGTHEQCNPFYAKKQKSQAAASLIESTQCKALLPSKKLWSLYPLSSDVSAITPPKDKTHLLMSKEQVKVYSYE